MPERSAAAGKTRRGRLRRFPRAGAGVAAAAVRAEGAMQGASGRRRARWHCPHRRGRSGGGGERAATAGRLSGGGRGGCLGFVRRQPRRTRELAPGRARSRRGDTCSGVGESGSRHSLAQRWGGRASKVPPGNRNGDTAGSPPPGRQRAAGSQVPRSHLPRTPPGPSLAGAERAQRSGVVGPGWTRAPLPPPAPSPPSVALCHTSSVFFFFFSVFFLCSFCLPPPPPPPFSRCPFVCLPLTVPFSVFPSLSEYPGLPHSRTRSFSP